MTAQHNIEFARVSQEVTERFCNRPAAPMIASGQTAKGSQRAFLGRSTPQSGPTFAPQRAAGSCRTADGAPRTAAAVDAEVEALVADAAATGRRVLLTLVDVSKTGLIRAADTNGAPRSGWR
jgi:DeoR/GlpR family transcriptional regulator of sugar metabolism